MADKVVEPPPPPPDGAAAEPPARITPGTTITQSQQPEPSDSGDPDQAMTRAPRAPHTWTPCPGSVFHVRQGPNYATHGRKAPSAAPLYDVVACDAYQSDQKLSHVGRVAALPEEPSVSDLPPLLVINFMIPNYPPSGLMAPKRVDGPGWNLVLYCRLSAAVRTALEQDLPVPPSVDLFKRFVHPTEGVNLRQSRLKMIMGLTDTEEPGFNMVTKSLVNRYNCKPFLSKTASSFYSIPGKYFEIDVDIHTWSSAALNGFNTIKSRMCAMLGRAGVVIEADEDDEMPEQILAGAYLTHLDPSKARSFDPALTRYLSDEKNFVPPLAGSLGGHIQKPA